MSRFRTASTLLVNILYGFYDHFAPVKYSDEPGYYDSKIIKTHSLNYKSWYNLYHETHDVYFVCSERKDKNLFINDSIKQKPNVFVFEYEDLIKESAIEDICSVLMKHIPEYPELAFAKERVEAMNKVCEEIKDKPFKYYDKFFQIHGSHRNRG